MMIYIVRGSTFIYIVRGSTFKIELEITSFVKAWSIPIESQNSLIVRDSNPVGSMTFGPIVNLRGSPS